MIAIRTAFVLVVASLGVASAGELTKEDCVEAHSKGQDAKEQGKLSLARKLFLTCAQPACPALVQGDCARFADELTQLQPTVSFVARDATGTDLADTTVYVDDVLVVARLDGKLHDLDPGTHVVKFQNGTKDQVVTIVIGTGEKARTIGVTFAAATPAATAATHPTGAAAEHPIGVAKTSHPGGARAVVVAGGLMVLAGAGLEYYGIAKLPASCTFSTHQCAAAPGDPAFDDARKAVRVMDVGFFVGGVGLAAVVGGLFWYYAGAKTSHEALVAAPWVTPSSAGLALSVKL